MNINISENTKKSSVSTCDNMNKAVERGNEDSTNFPSNVTIECNMGKNDDMKNLIEKTQYRIGISANLAKFAMDNKKNYYGLSPISEIASNLNDTNFDSTTPVKRFNYKEKSANNEELPVYEEVYLNSVNLCAKNTPPMMISMRDESKFDDQNLITNNCTLNSASSSAVSNSRNISAGRRLAARGAQRRLNIERHELNDSTDDHPDTNSSTNMTNNTMSIEDVSLYDDITTGTTTVEENIFRNENNNINIENDELYDNESIRNCNNELLNESSPQRFIVRNNTITILEKNHSSDGNSFDSGYSAYKITAPAFPIEQLLLESSPPHSLTPQNEHISPKQFRIFHSLSSGSVESMDDEYITDLIEMESLDDENEKFPTNLNTLISGHIKTIKTTPELKRSSVRRCLSLTETNIQLNNSNRMIRGSLFEPKLGIQSPKTPEFLKPIKDLSSNLTPFSSKQYEQQHRIGCFKRPEPPCFSPIQSKRYKTESIIITEEKENLQENNLNKQQRQRPILRKSISLNDAQIMTALARSTSEPDLIGDFSKSFCLPLIDGRHSDLKSISCETVAKLVNGEFNDSIETYKIIDCRYPYEFDGGHINGAQNLYTQEQVLNELVKCKTDTPHVQSDGPKRNILVFHCEFSSERGPKLSRFLRNYDRVQNANTYPALYYPEIYLLHNGYKEFYEKYSHLCIPVAYRPMLEPSFSDLYRQFRAKSKSWNGDIKASGSKIALKKSRSRLVL